MNRQLRNNAGLTNKHLILFGWHMWIGKFRLELGEDEDEAAPVRAA